MGKGDARSLERRKGGCDAYMRSLRSALNWAMLDTTRQDPVAGKPAYLDYNPFRQQAGAQDRVMFQRGGKLPRDLAARDLSRLLNSLSEAEESARQDVMRAATEVQDMEGQGREPSRPAMWALRDAQRREALRREERWLVWWYLLTGLRRAELINLTWRDVHLEGRMIRALGKGGKERMVPILDELVALIAEMGPKDLGRIFPRWSNYDAVSRLVKRIMRRAGIGDHSLHNLRDTYATTLLECGVSLENIQENMGHADISMTRKYSRVKDERRKAETISKVRFGGQEEK